MHLARRRTVQGSNSSQCDIGSSSAVEVLPITYTCTQLTVTAAAVAAAAAAAVVDAIAVNAAVAVAVAVAAVVHLATLDFVIQHRKLFGSLQRKPAQSVGVLPIPEC